MGSNKQARKAKIRELVAERLTALGLIEPQNPPRLPGCEINEFLDHFEHNVRAYLSSKKGRKALWQQRIISDGLRSAPTAAADLEAFEEKAGFTLDPDFIELYSRTNGLRLPGESWLASVESFTLFRESNPRDYAAQMKVFEEYRPESLPSTPDDEYFDYEHPYDWQPRLEYLGSCFLITCPAEGLQRVSYKDDGYGLLNPLVSKDGKLEVWAHGSWDDARYQSLYHYLDGQYQKWLDSLFVGHGI